MTPVSAGSTDLARAAVSLTPHDVLRRLAGVAGGDADGGLPAVSVHLAGGQVLNGLLVRVDDDHGHEVAVLSDADGGQLSYLLTAHVVAVTVHSPAPVRDVLTAGALPPATAGPAPSRLALRRDFPATEDFPLDLDWQALPDDGDALANLARLLGALREVVAEIRADETGRLAWARVRGLRVEHEPGQPLEVDGEPDRLRVRADLTAALPRQLAAHLGGQLNDLL